MQCRLASISHANLLASPANELIRTCYAKNARTNCEKPQR